MKFMKIDFERTIQDAFAELKRGEWLKKDDSVVVITKMRAGEHKLDTTQLRVIE